MKFYYVKSFEDDFSTKTLVGKEKRICQKVEDIVLSKKILPNTFSFKQKKRLSTTILSDNYLKTYRPQGIIFETNDKPDYILPFDLVLLSDVEKLVSKYYRIKDNLHFYYNHKLIDGYESFIFKNFDSMIKTISSPKIAWKKIKDFRLKNKLGLLENSKYKLVEYNEAVFLKPIKITPVALFGYKKETRELAKNLI